MEKNHSRRYQPAAGIPLSPRLLRSKSGTPAVPLPEIHTNTTNSGLNFVHRSKSTTRSRNEGNLLPSSTKTQKKSQENIKDHSFAKFFQRSGAFDAVKKTRPSAWTLSPGRSSPCSPAAIKPPSPGTLKADQLGGRGGVTGVLKYFRQKKVSPIQEEEFHRFRVLHNRLLQWRFVNARAQASMAAVKIFAEEKLLNVWLRILKLRNSIVEKQIQMQRFKHETKLYQIINPQICLLKEWGRLEGRNSEALGRLERKLSAISIRLPLVQGAKADVESVYDAMSTAMGIMNSMEATVTEFLPQAERTSYLLTEFVIMLEQMKEQMEELEKRIATIASLEAKERILRIHLIQVPKE